MDTNIYLALYNARLIEGGADRLAIETTTTRMSIPNPTPGLIAALRRMAEFEGASEGWMFEQLHGEPASSMPRLQSYLRRFDELGLIARHLHSDGAPLASMYPLGSRKQGTPFEPDHAYMLSRFAYMRRLGHELSVESPLAWARVVLHDARSLRMIGDLSAAELHTTRLNPKMAVQFKAFLADAGLLTRVLADGAGEEDTIPGLRQWRFHDLLFERGRREDHTIVATEAPMPIKPPMSEDVIRLATPDYDRLLEGDKPFTWVMEARHSIRQHDETPITLTQLAEFLFRCARVKDVYDGDYDATQRPYPSAGALYPLEIYAVVERCAGLERGLYHYMPLEHQIERLEAPSVTLDLLVENAVRVTGSQLSRPQVLLIITARYWRTAWKYDPFALSLIHKDVGVLMATMYLVATAMNLAPCALGVGHTSIFATVSGIDPLEEGAVGGFWLGTPVL
jgi:oxazoline/thiazoline dehydrogenase